MDPASILVVEDESIVALDIAQYLESMGYRVAATAASGEEAIERARELHPSLILMDMVLQGEMDGVQTAKSIGRSLHIPIVFLTAYNDADTVRRVAEVAPYGYLTKPFQARDLHAAIEVALYKSQAELRLRESEQWFSSTLRCVDDAIIATDPKAQIRFLNPVAEKLTGWSLDEAVGKPISEILTLLSGQGGGQIDNPAARALLEDKVIGLDHGLMAVARDGSRMPVDHSTAPIRGEDKQMLGAVTVLRDIRERMAHEKRLRESEERFRNAFDFAPAGMLLVAIDGRILRVNEEFCNLLGYAAAELLERHHADFSHLPDQVAERAGLYQLLTDSLPAVRVEKRYVHQDGRLIWTTASITVLKESGEPVCYLYTIHDMTERKNAEAELSKLAYYDQLTGLANRMRLRDELESLMASARRHRHKLAVVFIDLDRFKQINDSLGHEAGDELLRVVAQRLRNALRETDSVARLGGDEFVLAIPEIDTIVDVSKVTEKIRLSVARPVILIGQEVVVSPSMGVAIFPDDGVDVPTLLRNADSALYAAKGEGRNCVQFFKPEFARQAEERLILESALHRALEQREFFLVYQPIVSLANDAFTGFEALLRWRRDGEVVSPNVFIPITEETGFIVPLGKWVLEEACQAALRWPEPLVVNVNCSARQFRDEGFVDTIRAVLEATGLDPARLCLELTETVFLQGSQMPDHKLEHLQALGVTLSIDDYGTGYSSLAYLKRFAPSSLKIDGLFVHDLGENANSDAIVAATIAMGHQLGLRVVAECVETDAQLARLRAYGCDAIQGYFISPPVAAERVVEMIGRELDIAPL